MVRHLKKLVSKKKYSLHAACGQRTKHLLFSKQGQQTINLFYKQESKK